MCESNCIKFQNYDGVIRVVSALAEDKHFNRKSTLKDKRCRVWKKRAFTKEAGGVELKKLWRCIMGYVGSRVF